MPGTCDVRTPREMPVNERQTVSCFLYHDAAEEDLESAL
jgi:hypothetical protein